MYQSDFELGYVALNVRNLDLQSKYYQKVLGLSVIHQGESMIDLGVGKTVLVRLIKTEETLEVAGSYGLYHLAILLPSREALAQIFKHFVDYSVPLIGASDHDYSEAIYLEDTEEMELKSIEIDLFLNGILEKMDVLLGQQKRWMQKDCIV